MKSSKRYSNATFTKRVDHEAGRHRPGRSSPEPLVCEGCGCMFVHRRWIAAAAASTEMASKHLGPAQATTCPACVKKREGLPEGYVYLEGSFAAAHRDEIERLIANEAERAARRNPLARVIEWGTDENGLPRLSTTTTFLARRLGRALEKAFGGTVRYVFSHENRLVRTWWEKN